MESSIAAFVSSEAACLRAAANSAAPTWRPNAAVTNATEKHLSPSHKAAPTAQECIGKDAAQGRPHERPSHRADKQAHKQTRERTNAKRTNKQACEAPRLSKSNSTARLESNEPQTQTRKP